MPGGPVAGRRGRLLRRADLLAERALVVFALVLEFGGGEHVLGVDDEQQVAEGLEVDVPGVGRGRDIGDGLRVPRIADVDDAEALREHVSDKGIALVDHELDAIGAAALVGVADQLHVPCVVGLGQVLARHGRSLGSHPIGPEGVRPPA
jgi:hypothetical protein